MSLRVIIGAAKDQIVSSTFYIKRSHVQQFKHLFFVSLQISDPLVLGE